MGSYRDLRSISEYTEYPRKSNRLQRLLKQSLTISASAEGLNIFVFVLSNYTDNIYVSQVIIVFTGLEGGGREDTYVFKRIFIKLNSWTVFID